MQGRAEDTDERVKTPRTEMCEKSEVTSVEEGHDVERVIVAQSEETVEVAKAVEAQEKAEAPPRATRPPPWRDKHATIEYGRKSKRRCDGNESMLWLAASYLEYRATIQEGVMNVMPYFKKSGTCWNSSKHNTRSITQMIRMNWNVVVSSRNR